MTTRSREKDWGVLVVCHRPYLQWINKVLKGWDAECPGQKVLVLDDCPDFNISEYCGDWKVLHGKWGHPSPARNLGWKNMNTKFVFCWDADNIVPEGIGESVRRIIELDDNATGYYGPFISIDGTPSPHAGRAFEGSDEIAYWGGLETNGLWRRMAVALAGGWQPIRTEDIDLGFRVQALGWCLKNFGEAVAAPPGSSLLTSYSKRSHPNQRSLEITHEDRWWAGRTMAVVTTQRTTRMFEKWWEKGFLSQEYPDPRLMSLVIGLDEHPSSSGLREAVMRKVSGLGWKSVAVEDNSIKGIDSVVAHADWGEAQYKYWRSSSNIVSCLSKVHPATQLVLTWDDDTFPTDGKALRRLSDSLVAWEGETGCVAGWYAQRSDSTQAVVGESKSSWGKSVCVEKIMSMKGLAQVGKVGNGFALWRAASLRGMKGTDFFQEDKIMGWDFSACKFINRKNQKIIIDTDMFCEHDFSINPD